MSEAVIGLLDAYDVIVLVAYFILILCVGIWSSFQNRGGSRSYFLAGRSMTWLPVGASLFASNIGSGHFVGLAGSGAASGIGMGSFEMNAFFALTLLGWIFMPVYLASGIYTMPQYLHKRFGGHRIRIYLTVLSLIMYIFSKISADLYAGAIFIEQSLRISLYPAVALLLSLSALFTILGGLTAVIWTDFVQVVIMLGGAAWLAGAAFLKVPPTQLATLYAAAVSNETRYYMQLEAQNVTTVQDTWNRTVNVSARVQCGSPSPYAFHVFRPATDPELPWPGVVFGAVICCVWYWCTDQVIVQRTLSAKNILHVRAACILCSYLKLLPIFIILFPGLAARVLYPDELACADKASCEAACGRPNGCADIAYAKLVLTLMPAAARGLMLAVMLSALISSLTSIFSSASTIFTIDVWQRWRTQASEIEQMIVGRLFVLVLIAISIAWIPVVRSGSTLFQYIQSVSSYLAPPICAVYILAISWKRCTEAGAFWSLIVGLVTGLSWFLADSLYPTAACGQQSTKPAIFSIGYLHFGILLWLLTLATCVLVSLFSKPIDECKLHRLLYTTRLAADSSKSDQLQLVFASSTGNQVAPCDGDKNPSLDKVVQLNDCGHCLNDNRTSNNQPKCYLRLAYWLCGIETLVRNRNQSNDVQVQDDPSRLLEKLHVKKNWALAVNVNAVLVILVSIALWIYLA